ncbi:MAG: bifunctional precorrin-2 dehydrogenase/sirohydrochlorin ferrochelatase [Dehalococcoidia bacterium]|nr:bifunctional precorrin-2 dehydrogenase/sirohydrochlorin ferrochelatase [Dehalococcoidia bacterium]
MGLIVDLLPAGGRALVVGAGTVAARKIRNLVDAGFPVVVVAPAVHDEIRQIAEVSVVERLFAPADLDGDPPVALVFACTDDRAVNAEVGRLARERRILVLVADRQEESTFFTPATLRDGDLAVAVSTGGASPLLARELRERVVAALGPGWGRLVEAARRERAARLSRERAEPGP